MLLVPALSGENGVRSALIEREARLKICKNGRGRCLSKEYINCRSKLTWQCKQGHQWVAVPSSIKRGIWCRTCATNAQRATLEEMQEIAEQREGKCVSKEYINNYSKLTWQCKQGTSGMPCPVRLNGDFGVLFAQERNKSNSRTAAVFSTSEL
jgi:hypothetical protein